MRQAYADLCRENPSHKRQCADFAQALGALTSAFRKSVVVVVVVVVVGFFWLWLLPYSQVYFEQSEIRVSRRFLCTDHAVQGTFGNSGMTTARVG
jgi:hypothetical protein